MRFGSLFTGLGLLDEGVMRALGGGRLAWFAESPGATAEAAVRMVEAGHTRRQVGRALRVPETGKRRTAAQVAALLLDARRSAYCRWVVGRRHVRAVDVGDVCGIDPRALEPVDVLTAGFPCQDISPAGAGAGIDGDRSGLWGEVARYLRGLRPGEADDGRPPWADRPDVVVLENSGALPSRGLSRVLLDLHGAGYSAGWQVIGAVGVGAPHIRARTAIVALRRREGAPDRLPVWPDLAPLARANLSRVWTLERHPWPLAMVPSADAALTRWRTDALAALGNSVVLPWAEAVGRAARDARPPECEQVGGQIGLFGAGEPVRVGPVGAQRIGTPGEMRTLPLAGALWDGALYEVPRVYAEGDARAIVETSPVCRFYGLLMPTPVAGDARRGPTPTPRADRACARQNRHPNGLASAAPAMTEAAGRLMPTPRRSEAYRGGLGAERRRHTPGLASVALMLAEAAAVVVPTPTCRDTRSGAASSATAARNALVATPTLRGNDNRAGLTARSGDGLATQARAMCSAVANPGGGPRATLLHPLFVAYLMGAGPEQVPPPDGVDVPSGRFVDWLAANAGRRAFSAGSYPKQGA